MFNIVIPSALSDNLVPCVKSILDNDPAISPRQIIVIDDGAKEGAYKRLPIGIQWITGIKPFVYARNVNLGIQESKGSVLLLNDDALLKTPNGFSKLAQAAEEYGIVSASTNSAGNRNQFPKRSEVIRPEPRMVCFICTYLPKNAIQQVGLLDEEFIGYGFEDDSYCLRARRENIKLGIFDGCFVDHLSLPSTFRGKGGKGGDLAQNGEIFRQKYGAMNHEL